MPHTQEKGKKRRGAPRPTPCNATFPPKKQTNTQAGTASFITVWEPLWPASVWLLRQQDLPEERGVLGREGTSTITPLGRPGHAHSVCSVYVPLTTGAPPPLAFRPALGLPAPPHPVCHHCPSLLSATDAVPGQQSPSSSHLQAIKQDFPPGKSYRNKKEKTKKKN